MQKKYLVSEIAHIKKIHIKFSKEVWHNLNAYQFYYILKPAVPCSA